MQQGLDNHSYVTSLYRYLCLTSYIVILAVKGIFHASYNAL